MDLPDERDVETMRWANALLDCPDDFERWVYVGMELTALRNYIRELKDEVLALRLRTMTPAEQVALQLEANRAL